MRTAVIGDGGWGTALALILARNGHAVTVWGAFPDYVAQVERERRNPRFLPNVPLPAAVHFTGDRTAVREAELVVLAVPSQFFHATLESFASGWPATTALVSVTKGLERGNFRRMTEVAGEIFQRRDIAALSGPSLADEVARGAPTAVTVACAEAAKAARVQQAFGNELFRVYTSDDVIGVELGGAFKNVIALAAGVCDGLGFGANTKAALVTRGLAEMTRLGVAAGARPDTFAGLSGLGDLMVTCGSPLSRNRGVGERLGRGEKIEAILESMNQVAEGVWTCPTVVQLAQRLGVAAPITVQVDAMLREAIAPREAVKLLMGRDPRPERDG